VRGDRRARIADHMIHHLDAYLSACQLGITLASLALGWIGEPAFAWLIGPVFAKLGISENVSRSISLSLAFVTITVLHIVLGEQAPKSLAIRKPQPTSLWIAFPLFGFFKVTYPIIWLLNRAATGLLKLIGIQPATEHEVAHGEEELRLLFTSPGGAKLGKQKRELLDNIFELSHRTLRQVMVPRADVVYLSLHRSFEENIALAQRTGHTRFPLCSDQLDDIVGLVHIKDLFRRTEPLTSLEAVRREIRFLPETLTLDRALRQMRLEHAVMAAVIDEYGGVSGIVTLENVIEEIVGPIEDEFDQERPEIVKRGEMEYLVSGGMLVRDLEDELRLDFSDRDEDTIAGVVLSELGRTPHIGDRVHVGPLTMEVVDVARNRIRSLKVKLSGQTIAPPPADELPP